jgi:hypothetical protein
VSFGCWAQRSAIIMLRLASLRVETGMNIGQVAVDV